jgi:TonB family protein
MMMRCLAWIGLVGFLAASGAGTVEAGGAPPTGNYYTRLRANDAPVAGRFTIYGYLLDSLDAVVKLPGPGRVMAVNLRESNGDNAFVVSGDLSLIDSREHAWQGGFQSLDGRRFSGLLGKNDSRWALWWIPWGGDSLSWNNMRDLRMAYGLSKEGFVPLGDDDAAATLEALPWDRIRRASIDPDRTLQDLSSAIDPAAFDQPPTVLTQKPPVYPRAARQWDFEGTVNVVAVVNEEGKVTDAFVLQSDAAHELNVAALAAVMKWTFSPGLKEGRPAAGGVVVPIRFDLGTVK